MRKPGEAPAFRHIIEEIQDAQTEWTLGNRGKAERMLRLAASIAYAESEECGLNNPVPEIVKERSYR